MVSLCLRETDLYFLVGKALKSFFGLGQNLLFFEVPVGGSRADIVYFQEPVSYETVLPAGIHVFEVKMSWDNDGRRMEKQIRDYLGVADYVWLVGVNRVFTPRNENVGVLVFSTGKTGLDVERMPVYDGSGQSPGKRRVFLDGLESVLKRKHESVRSMRFVSPSMGRLLVQEKLA